MYPPRGSFGSREVKRAVPGEACLDAAILSFHVAACQWPVKIKIFGGVDQIS